MYPQDPKVIVLAIVMVFLCTNGSANAKGICRESGIKLTASQLAAHALRAKNIQEVFGNRGRLYYVAILGSDRALSALLDGAGTTVEIDSIVMLRVASIGDLEKMYMLIKAGGNIDARSKRGATPLMAAAQCHEPEMMSLLISNGADVNAELESGDDAMFTAITEGQLNEVVLLINHGYNLEKSRLDNGLTPIEVAQRYGYSKIIKTLKAARAKDL